MAELKELGPRLNLMIAELDKRAAKVARNQSYIDASCPVPEAVAKAHLRKAYNVLMPMAGAPWASLVVDSVQDRLEVGGIRFGDEGLEQKVWSQGWQANALDAMAPLAHNGILSDGRAFATIWPDAASGEPEIVLDGADQMVVMYAEGRHQPRHRVAALRRWVDDADREHVTLYTATALYKLSASKEQTQADDRVEAGGKWWEQREEIGRDSVPEPWPLPNPFNVVPVVELATNRRLKPGSFAYARGEFEHCIGLLDRIHLLTFLGMVVALWMGFPLRGVIGDKILRDDDDNPLPPFEAKPDQVVQFENEKTQFAEFKAADRGNLSIFEELSQLAYVTKTPAHYFPLASGLSNISADAIRALEGGLHAKVNGIHKPFIGEGWEEVLRVAGAMMKTKIVVPPTAQIHWIPRESRSMAEAADAAGKIAAIGFPPLFVAEKYLNFTQEDLARVKAMAGDDVLTQLLEEARNTPTPQPEPEPVA